MSALNPQSERSVRTKQFKVWTLMATSLIVGILLAFGRWATDDRIPTMFGHVAWHAFPAGWVLVIQYGVLILMVAAFIRADRVDALFSSTETLTWLGGICLFTAGLYHDHHGYGPGIWGAGVNGYGTFTEFLSKPSLSAIPLLLSAWPMAYGAIATATSFTEVMGWKRTVFHWRWLVHALFLISVTAIWTVLGLWSMSGKADPSWLVGSLIVLPTLGVALDSVRDPERKLHWMNVIAMVWIVTALFPRFENAPATWSMAEALTRMDYGYRMLVLGAFLILTGSLSSLCSKTGGQVRARTVQEG